MFEPLDVAQIDQPIMNGTDWPEVTNLSEAEEMAIGFFIVSGEDEPFCSGTAIERDVVLTAQHCLEDRSDLAQVRFGVGEPGDPTKLVKLDRISHSGSEYDVALVLLEDSLGVAVDPISVNRESLSSSLIGREVEVSGFHVIHGLPLIRRYAVVLVSRFDDDWLVLDGEGERGICNGDSGGPVLMHDSSGRPVVAGVNSWTQYSCRDVSRHGRVDSLISWIDTEVDNFDSSGYSRQGTGPAGNGWRLVVPGCSSVTGSPRPGFGFFLLVAGSVLALRHRLRRPGEPTFGR